MDQLSRTPWAGLGDVCCWSFSRISRKPTMPSVTFQNLLSRGWIAGVARLEVERPVRKLTEKFVLGRGGGWGQSRSSGRVRLKTGQVLGAGELGTPLAGQGTGTEAVVGSGPAVGDESSRGCG